MMRTNFSYIYAVKIVVVVNLYRGFVPPNEILCKNIRTTIYKIRCLCRIAVSLQLHKIVCLVHIIYSICTICDFVNMIIR